MGRLVDNRRPKNGSRSARVKVLIFTVIISLLLVYTPVIYGVSPEWSGNKANSFAGGTGTETDPYLISNGEELAYFRDQINKGVTYADKYIILTQDILLNQMKADGTFFNGSPKKFTEQDTDENIHTFLGYFDGKGKEIIGLYIERNWIGYQGLFRSVGAGSEIRDLIISGSVVGGNRSGAVAGYSNGLITGCVVNCSVTANGRAYHGGIIGYGGVDSRIDNCTLSGTIGGSDYIGGIAGYTEGKISGCESNSTVSGTSKIGGIVGYAAGTTSEIRNCTFSGTVDANGEPVGGIAGQTDGLITGCAMSGKVKGKSGTIGGIVGYAAGVASHINDCSVTGRVEATGGYGYVGGVAGETDGKITGCAAECPVIAAGQHYVGGVAGSASTGSEISNSSSSGDISGTGKIGGIAGYTDGDISICINTGNVNGGGSGYAGGVAGEAGNNSTVGNSFNSGDVTGGGQGNIGGIVGHASSDTVVHHNLNKGTVNGNNPQGSVIGNTINPDNVQNNYYYDYEGAPGGSQGSDIEDKDGAVPIGDLTWEEIQDLLNQNNDAGDDVWNQDMDDDGIPKPGAGSGSAPPAVIKVGKYYAKGDLGSSTIAEVTADSVFTVAFSLKHDSGYTPADLTLKLTPREGSDLLELPKDTSIIMRAEGAYYYLNLDSSVNATVGITLGSFIKMGTEGNNSNGNKFNAGQVASGAKKEYLFVFDFTRSAAGIPAGSYDIELAPSEGTYSGTKPVLTVTGQKSYALSVNVPEAEDSANTFSIDFDLAEGSAFPGYDYKTNGRTLVCEFYLEGNGNGGRSLPIGTKINDTYVAAELPYAFIPVDLGHESTITLDMSECDNPLVGGDYTIHAIVYACSDLAHPRGGYVLVEDSETINITAPVEYAIKAEAAERVFERQQDPEITVSFNIQTVGADTVKASLQKKYGKSYENIAGHVGNELTINAEEAEYTIPTEDLTKGTYRFLIKLHDGKDIPRAESIVNIIIR